MAAKRNYKPIKVGKGNSVSGEYYATPKEVWGALSPAVEVAPRRNARDFLLANRQVFGLAQNLLGLEIQRIVRSLGATHVILKQKHRGARIHRAYVTVHINQQGRVYLVKNRAVPSELLSPAFEKRIVQKEAIRRARRSLRNPSRRIHVRETEQLWFPRKDKVLPAWKVRLIRETPREEWIIYVNAKSGAILNRYDNLSAAEAPALVFDPNPVTALGDHELLLASKQRPRHPPPIAYRDVVLNGLDGSGTLSGERVTTAPTRGRLRRAKPEFKLKSNERGFEEVMVYFHIDAALCYLEALGYRGSRAIFREPVRANVNGTPQDNSWYSPQERLLTFGTGAIDDAEDAETILHELGHAIQDAICPDFGQSDEAAAMGEGFGDYFAASFFESRKPARYKDTVMSWDGLLIGLGDRSDPPALRRLDSRLTFNDFEAGGDEHENGKIWSATLWDIRNVLGREIADRVIIESHFQLDGFTTFARGARAILDADRNLYRGKHLAKLKKIFTDRKVGPL